MSPTKLLDEILSVLTKYGPIVLVNLLLFVWLMLRVIDPTSIPDINELWVPIDSSLKAVDLSGERWAAMLALAIAYLVTFQWIQNAITKLPLLRVPFPSWPPPQLIGRAAEKLRVRPEFWKIYEALRDLMEQASRKLGEPGHPYSPLIRYDQVNTWYTYYGACLTLLAAAIIWWFGGANYARSAYRVHELIFLLLIFCFVTRWKTKSELGKRETALAYWALDRFESETSAQRADPLSWRRRQLVEKQAEFQRARDNHPAELLRRLIHYWLPTKVADKLSSKLDRPEWWFPYQDWEIFESENMLYTEEEQPPPKALRVESYTARFEPLLECTGAGLFMLVPFDLGLAPSVSQGGASYCFGMRRHGGNLLPITLQADGNLEHASIRCDSSPEAPAFLVEIGSVPIEQLAQRYFPFSVDADWFKLVEGRFEPEIWTQLGDYAPVTYGDLTLTNSVDLHPGSSYLLGARTRLGTCVSVAFQCFCVANVARVIVAWRILNVSAAVSPIPKVLPWWKPAAWRDLIKSEHYVSFLVGKELLRRTFLVVTRR